ncbi:hypothetical protein [Maribacter sp. 2304DJ31-5]
MKNKRTFLASIALGIFLLATVAPVITIDQDSQQLGVDKTKIRIPGRR